MSLMRPRDTPLDIDAALAKRSVREQRRGRWPLGIVGVVLLAATVAVAWWMVVAL